MCLKGEFSIFYQLLQDVSHALKKDKVYQFPYKSKETVNLIKYNSQFISVKHRRSIPYLKWLQKYSQLWAAQKSFYMDKKHVTFNLSAALYYHTSFWFSVLNSYTNNLSQSRCSHV